jgi:hypothetical protein
MTKKRKFKGTHIRLNTYNSIEGAVLIHVHSYDWFITPKIKLDCKREIVHVVANERSKNRILVAFKNGKQVLERGIF